MAGESNGTAPKHREGRGRTFVAALKVALPWLLLGVTLTSIILLCRWVVLGILSLESGIAAVVLGGLIALLGSVVVKAIEHYSVAAAERKARLAEQRREMYERFITVWFDVVWEGRREKSKKQGAHSVARSVERLQKITPNLVVWGSDDLLRLYAGWRTELADGKGEPTVAVTGLYRLICQVRREVGHGESDLTPSELLGVFMSDADEYFPQPRS